MNSIKDYPDFKSFYPYYLSEHQNFICRVLHFIGTFGVILIIISAILINYKLFFFAPLCGYSFAWAGHFFFEKNKPATFKYPLFSLIGDFVMFFHIVIGKEKINPQLKNKS